jgi:hypothetical protein
MVKTNDGRVPALVGKNVLFQWPWIKLELGLIFYQKQELEPDFYFFLVNWTWNQDLFRWGIKIVTKNKNLKKCFWKKKVTRIRGNLQLSTDSSLGY